MAADSRRDADGSKADGHEDSSDPADRELAALERRIQDEKDQVFEDLYGEEEAERVDERYEANVGAGLSGWLFRVVFGGGFAWMAYNAYLFNTKGDNAAQEFGYQKDVYRSVEWITEKLKYVKKYLVEPPLDKVLAKELPVIPGLIPKRKTIVLELDDVIIKQDMKFGQAPELILRPGLRKFLQDISRNFEIVVISSHKTENAILIMNNLDGFQRLDISSIGNEFQSFRGGELGFDLSILNRADSDLVVIAHSKDMFLSKKDNIIEVPKFEGTAEDDLLFQLMPLLNHLGSERIKSIPAELEKLGENPVREFQERVKTIIEQKQQKQTSQKKFFTLRQ